MFDPYLVLTPLHYIYLIGVIVILAVMILRKDTPLVCIFFLFLLGLVGLKSLTGGIMTVFNSILYASRQFMEIIATIALVTALSKCLKDLGSDYLMMIPMSKVMKSPSLTWWILGGTMLVFSLFLWPSPSVALVGAIMLRFAVRAGLDPLAAAMAMNLFGHGFALSYDFVIQGAPAISAGAASISASDVLTKGRPLFLVMGIVTVVSAYLLNRNGISACCQEVHIQNTEEHGFRHCCSYHVHWGFFRLWKAFPGKGDLLCYRRLSLCHTDLCSRYHHRGIFLFRRRGNFHHHGGTVSKRNYE